MPRTSKLDALMKIYERECEQEAIHTEMKKSVWKEIQAILEEEEFIRPTEASKILGVSAQTVINWIRTGRFRPEEYRQISEHTYVISKRVIKRADFYERRRELRTS